MERIERVVLIQSSDRYVSERVAMQLCRTVRLRGGTAWAGWGRPTIKVRVQGVSREQMAGVRQKVETFAVRRRLSLAFTSFEVQVSPIPEPSKGAVKWGTVIHQRLTRRLLMELPDGAGVFVPAPSDKPGCHLAFFVVLSQGGRDEVWLRALELKAAYRVCRVFWDF